MLRRTILRGVSAAALAAIMATNAAAQETVKIGLILPLGEWLSEPQALGRYVDDLAAADGRVRPFADAPALDRTIAAFKAGRRSLAGPLFRMVNVELWLRGLEEKPKAVSPGPEFRAAAAAPVEIGG